MMAKAQAFVDTWLAKLTSRKLMVWLTATGLTLTDHVTSETHANCVRDTNRIT